MTDKQATLLKAGEAALRIDAAKAGVEAAKAAVEAARAALDAAKGAVDEAKAEFEAALEACESAGIPKAKARKAVEALNQVFVEAGVIEAPEAASAPAEAGEAVQPRKKRRSKADEAEAASQPAEAPAHAVAEEPTAAQAADGPSSQPEVAPAAAASEAPAASDQKKPDFSVEAEEIATLIDEALAAEKIDDPAAAESAARLLNGLLAAFVESASEGRRAAVVDFESFSQALVETEAKALASGTSFEQAFAEAPEVLTWFRGVIEAVENSQPFPRLVQPSADQVPSDDASIEVPAAEAAVAGTVADAIEETIEDDVQFSGEPADAADLDHDDYLPDLPDYDQEYPAEDAYPEDISEDDDRSFPEEVPGDIPDEVEVVSDIGSINFLEDEQPEGAAASVEPAPAAEPEKPAAPAEADKPKPRGGFAPPSFLKPRS